MNVLKKFTTDRAILFIVFWCVFSFKITLGGVSDAGLRPDDLLIALAFVLLFVRGSIFTTPLTKPFKLYALFVGIGIVSSLWNGVEGRVNLAVSVLYDVRLVEYMLFYYIGYFLANHRRSDSIRKLFTLYFWLMAVVVPLQMLQIIPVPGGFGYLRASGNTNGPYEFAAVASFLLCYLGYQRRSSMKGCAAIVLVILSASRITFAGVFVSLYRFLLRLGKRNLRAAVMVSAALLLTSVIGITVYANGDALADSGIRLFSRLGSARANGTVTTFFEVYPQAPVYQNSSEYLEGTFFHSCDSGACDEALGDTSATIRIFKWASLIKSTLFSWDSTVLGLGPSFASTAVDGYYVRMFAETGLLGSFVFFFSMFSFWQKRFLVHWAFREYVLILLISGLFIDIFTSYKAMILLWLWHGLNEGKLALREADEKSAVYEETAVLSVS